MDILDKLFSKEIERRTGAHAINILIEENKSKKRSRTLGANALNATKITTKQRQGSFFHRLNIRFPWLKLVAVIVIGGIVLLDLLDFTISKTGDPYNKIRIAPMSHHVRITNRDLNDKMLVVLTFDDGPSSLTTPKLLDILTEKDVPATFFMLGRMARSNPDIVKTVQKQGHEIASHTMYHQNLVRISPSAVQADINEAKTVFSDILNNVPKYTRPPYGNINDAVKRNVGTPMILWSVDTLDWQSKDPDAIVSTAMSQIHDGAIILMHDVYPTTIEAVPTLIDKAREAGYEFASLAEITKIRNVNLENGVPYYNFRP